MSWRIICRYGKCENQASERVMLGRNDITYLCSEHAMLVTTDAMKKRGGYRANSLSRQDHEGPIGRESIAMQKDQSIPEISASPQAEPEQHS